MQRFLAEDVVPRDLLQGLVREWTSPAASVILTVVAEDDAEAIRRELADGRHGPACGLLLNRAFEILLFSPLERECESRAPAHR